MNSHKFIFIIPWLGAIDRYCTYGDTPRLNLVRMTFTVISHTVKAHKKYDIIHMSTYEIHKCTFNTID